MPSQYALFATGYNAMKQGDYDRAYRVLSSSIQIYQRGDALNSYYFYAYLMRAAAKAGKRDAVELALEQARKADLNFSRESKAFDYHLAAAFVAAEDDDHDRALKNLDWAFGIKPVTEYRPVMPWFQVVEAAIWLYEDFGDPRYLSRALEWAKSYQVIAPMHAWAFSVVAKYSKDPGERRQALAMALYLDRNSWLLSKIPDSEKHSAQQWFEEMRLQGQSQGKADGKQPNA